MKLHQPQKLIAKVGTDTLTAKNGSLHRENITRIITQLVDFIRADMHVALVTSGAKAAGREQVDFIDGLSGESLVQGFTSVGQVPLLEAYADALRPYGIKPSPAFPTKDDFHNPSHLGAFRTPLRGIFRDSNILPIVNNNDMLGLREIRFTDNDELTYYLAKELMPDTVFLLTSTDGLYDKCPKMYPDSANLITGPIDPLKFDFGPIEFGASSSGGSGGMRQKVLNAIYMAQLGIQVIIANGTRRDIMTDIIDGKRDVPFTYVKPVVSQQTLPI